MAITLTMETEVNSTALAFENRQAYSPTWDDATYTWNQATGTWDVPSVPIIEEDEINSVSLSLETR
jgi:hypothetical protein